MLTMMGEGNRRNPNPTNLHPNPTVSVPPWSLFNDDPYSSTEEMKMQTHTQMVGDTGGGEYSQLMLAEALNALQHYLPSNQESESDIFGRESDIPVDAFSCDEFRMYEFKIRRCARGRSHDWTECPYAHPGEKARRRDPRKFHYSGTACPDFRKGSCKRGDTCEYAHGVFECWLHPARYRTQPCKDGTNCRRRVCFFAHTPDQLRVLAQQSPRVVTESPPSYDGSPLRQALDSYYAKGSSPTSTLFTPPVSPPSESPPMSPRAQMLSRSVGANSVNDMVLASLRHLQLNKLAATTSGGIGIGSSGGSAGVSPRGIQISGGISTGLSPRGIQIGCGGFLSPRAVSSLRPSFSSLPNTPTQKTAASGRSGFSKLNFWDTAEEEEEPVVMDRVESGRELRSKMYEKLSKENSLGRSDAASPGPDVDWVSDLIK